MSKYFELVGDKNNKRLAYPSEETLIFVNAKMREYAEQGKDHSFVEELIINYLMGKDVEDMYDFRFYYFPERVDDIETNKSNIKIYFEEVMRYYQYVEDEDYKDDREYIDKIYDAVNSENIDRVVNYLKERKISPSENKALIESKINDNKISKYDEYDTYANAIIARNNRPKRKFWQIFEYFRRKNEDKALNKMEKHLKSIGVSQDLLDRTKNGYGCNQEEFKNHVSESIHDRLENFKNRVGEGFYEYNLDASKKDEKLEENFRYFERLNERTYEQVLPIYNSVKIKHLQDMNKPRNEFEQKDFEQEEAYLNSFEKLAQNKLGVSKYEFDQKLREYANKGVQIEVLLDKEPKAPLDDKIRYERLQGIREELVEENSEYDEENSLDDSMEIY